MTEFELITILVDRRSELISLVQWWAGVSFAILAGSQIYESRLSFRLVLLVEIFYICFTLATFRLVNSLGQQFQAAFVDLKAINDPSEQTLTMIAQNSSGSVEVNIIAISAVSVAVILVSVAYPIWLLRANRRAGAP